MLYVASIVYNIIVENSAIVSFLSNPPQQRAFLSISPLPPALLIEHNNKFGAASTFLKYIGVYVFS